jgi:glycosyltransferase A (GT-A) superfamily protein (DUF2064 family)
MTAVVVLAKEPLPGRVKTRLCPPYDHAAAARLAAAALTDTLDAVDELPATERILAFEGQAARWLRPGWRLVPQVGGGLDRRIAAALRAATGPVILVGMDTPQLAASHLAGLDLDGHDACLGPSTDGGYWAIGLASPELAGPALHGVPMSRDDTGAIQRRRLDALGLRVQMLPELTDADTAATAAAVAAAAPASRFAAVLADVTAQTAAARGTAARGTAALRRTG